LSFSSATAAWIAIAAAAVAVLALLAVVWVLLRIRRLREGQAVLLGDGKTDLVDFAVSLQGRIDDLHRAVDEIAAGLVRVDRRMDASVTNTSIVRYDAYEDTGGRQSASLAMLDSARQLVEDRDALLRRRVRGEELGAAAPAAQRRHDHHVRDRRVAEGA